MKAIVVREFGAPQVMKLETASDPAAGPGQVVIRVKAAGVNPVDTYVRSGIYPRKPPLPYSPGMDAAGVVESVGTGVTRVKPGDRVYAFLISGAYAELAVCEETQVRALPEKASFEQGAALGIPYDGLAGALLPSGSAAGRNRARSRRERRRRHRRRADRPRARVARHRDRWY